MILVTGATGNVGHELVPQLLDLGQPVRVFTRNARKAAPWGERVEVAVGDFDQPQTLEAAMQGVEQLFLVTTETDSRHTEAATQAAKRAGVRHIVYLSSMGAGDTTFQIGKWHHDREEIVRASGLAWTFLRPGMFMSNALQWAEMIRGQDAVYFPGGEGKSAPMAPYDIAAVAAAALTQPGHDGKIYEMTGSELLTIGEMVGILAQALGRPLRYVDIPPSVAREQMIQHGMDTVLADAVTELFTAMREGRGDYRTETAEQILGRPLRTFENWCREHVAAFQ